MARRKPPVVTSPPKIERKSIKNWLQGTVTAFDDGRTPVDGLRDSSNVILDQDGTVRPRPSLTPYGPQPLGIVLGEIFEFSTVTNNLKTYWLICLQNVDNVTSVYVAKGEDSSWTKCNGKTYNNTAPAHFIQIDRKVLVMNGEDYLSFVDTATFVVTGYAIIAAPATPTLDVNTGLAGTAYKVYYAVTANSTVGETEGSGVLTQQVLIDRDLWNPDTQGIKIKWTTVTGVRSWNVYMGVAADGAGQPKLYCIATGIDPTILSFTDNGTRQQDVSRPLPTTNGTAGPRTSRGDVSNGRVWMTGDKDHPFYVWRGGDFGFELDFSPANGGGYTPVGNGTKEVPVAVKGFRNGKGDAMLMVLSQGSNGTGKRFYLSPQNVTFGSSTFVVWKVDEDSGQDGTDSPDGLIIYQNSAYYPSRDGFKTTGTKPQLQNILSTDRISNTIQTDISTINTSAMIKCVGLAFEGRLYWSLPIGGTKNSQIWVLDLDRKGAWMKPWSIPADWMVLYNDNSGRTHFLMLVNNQILEMSYSAKTADNGVAFSTSANSGQVKFSEDGREWGRLIQLVFVLLRPQGPVNFSVSGQSEDGVLPYSLAQSFATQSTQVGFSEVQAGFGNAINGNLRGFSEIKRRPKTNNPATVEVPFEIDEDLQWFSYGWGSTEPGVDYNVADVIAEYVNVGIKDLS
ncbi:MAG: hypothetical protein EON54_01320 [Alcaligenaceae bacterium]|nr:MAG: hypothetical protein EON54_01320 [Alcaligenaceae bacterium]